MDTGDAVLRAVQRSPAVTLERDDERWTAVRVGERTVARVDSERRVVLVYATDTATPMAPMGPSEAIAEIRGQVRLATLRWQLIVASP